MPGNVHRNIVECMCGENGRREFPLKDGRRLDCLKPDTCVEVELNKGRIPKALSRLETGESEGLCVKQVLVIKDKDARFAKSLVQTRGISVVSTSHACVAGAEPEVADKSGWAWLALGLLLVGGVALAASRKRGDYETQ